MMKNIPRYEKTCPGLATRSAQLKKLATAMKMNTHKLSLVIRKPAFCIFENIDTDQMRSNCAIDQLFCFRYSDSTITLLSKSGISSL